MYQVDDTVCYGASGVCRVVEISQRKSGKNLMEYYTLEPLHKGSVTIFVPTGNEVLVGRMRPVLTREDISHMLQALPQAEEVWVEGSSARQALFREILQSGDPGRILQLLKSLYLHRIQCKNAGRKFRIVDEKVMKEAEEILCQEFSFVLELPREEILPLIESHISA